MPTFSEKHDYVYSEHSRSHYLNAWNVEQKSNFFFRTQRTYPVTVSRTKPIDLFRLGTSRVTSSVMIQNHGAINVHYGSLRRVYGEMPSYVYTHQRVDALSLYPALPPIDYELIHNHIRNQMRGKVVNLAMALYEYRKTAVLFREAARFVTSRGKSLASALNKPKGASKAFLGFQYGVRPLASDILGSIDELKAAAGKPLYLSGHETRRAHALSPKYVDVLSSSSTTMNYKADVVLEQHRYTRVKWRAKLSGNSVQNVLTAHGFTNPFSLAYEAVPYSFVVDWWINVGEVLASLDNLLLCDELLVVNSNSVIRRSEVTFADRFNVDSSVGRTAGACTYIKRTDTRSSPTAISRVNTFRYKPSISKEHILNGLALLRVAQGRFH